QCASKVIREIAPRERVIGSKVGIASMNRGSIDRPNNPSKFGRQSRNHRVGTSRISRTWFVCLLLLIAAGGKLAVMGTQAADEPKINVQPAPIPRESRPTLSFAPIVKKVSSSVVTIYSTKRIKDNSKNPLLNDPFLRRFFGLEEDDDSATRRP